jgi:hypothetical protein
VGSKGRTERRRGRCKVAGVEGERMRSLGFDVRVYIGVALKAEAGCR